MRGGSLAGIAEKTELVDAALKVARGIALSALCEERDIKEALARLGLYPTATFEEQQLNMIRNLV